MTETEERAKAEEAAQSIASMAYDHAVTMHESIVVGKGATGWRDEELVCKVTDTLLAFGRAAAERERERALGVIHAAYLDQPMWSESHKRGWNGALDNVSAEIRAAAIRARGEEGKP